MENSFFQKYKYIIYSLSVILIYFIFLYLVYFYDLSKISSEDRNSNKSPYKLLYFINKESPMRYLKTLEEGTTYLGSFQIPEGADRIEVTEKCTFDSDYNFYPLPEVSFSDEINTVPLMSGNSVNSIRVFESKASLLYVYDFNTKVATQLDCGGYYNVENTNSRFISPDRLIILDNQNFYENENENFKNKRTLLWFGNVVDRVNSNYYSSMTQFDTITVNGQKVPYDNFKLNPFAPAGEKDIFYGVEVLGWIK